MDANKLTAYREAAKAAEDMVNDMPVTIASDKSTATKIVLVALADAVDELCAEVERLQTRRQLVIDAFTEADKRSSEMSWAIHVLREPKGDA